MSDALDNPGRHPEQVRRTLGAGFTGSLFRGNCLRPGLNAVSSPMVT